VGRRCRRLTSGTLLCSVLSDWYCTTVSYRTFRSIIPMSCICMGHRGISSCEDLVRSCKTRIRQHALRHVVHCHNAEFQLSYRSRIQVCLPDAQRWRRRRMAVIGGFGLRQSFNPWSIGRSGSGRLDSYKFVEVCGAGNGYALAKVDENPEQCR
jgi:hypothetical protein